MMGTSIVKAGIHYAGVAIPFLRLPLHLIPGRTGDGSKSFSSFDEDVITIALEAVANALQETPADMQIQAVYFGTESKPYAVKSSAGIVAEALGLNFTSAADIEFACKASTEAIRIALCQVESARCSFALAIGADTAQSRPGDDLESTAAAAGAAVVIGAEEDSIAVLGDWCSYISDTPDFFRKAEQRYPSHSGRFTGQPSYFRHTISAAETLLQSTGMKPSDFDHVVFHQPNSRFPHQVACQLGFSEEQLASGLFFDSIGNPYAASTLLGLVKALDTAKPKQKILCVSYGSGAGSDAFVLTVTDNISRHQQQSKNVDWYLNRGKQIDDYGKYLLHTGQLN